ncbi:MAG: hypothetical protein HYU52_11225 [Acidobacteria bacterium]|nr:hypothetical protein [Acidobacteriota bacterium]
MSITIKDPSQTLRVRLRERLERTAELRCATHGRAVIAVRIHGFDNGWFDSMWTTCCPALERQASSILKTRC